MNQGTCPHCGGTKKVLAVSRYVEAWQDCQTCLGTGAVSHRKLMKIKAGKAMRQQRLDAHRSLREEASRLGITPQQLARMERGEP